MLEALSIKNLKALQDVRLTFEPLTVLVGPNASGKSSVLDAIHRLSRVGSEMLIEVFGDPAEIRTLRTRGATGAIELIARGRDEGVPWSAGVELSAAPRPDGPVPYGRYTSSWGDQQRSRDLKGLNDGFGWGLPGLDAALRPTEILRLDAARLARPAYSLLAGQVAFDGAGLPAALNDIVGTWPERWEAIQQALKAIVPAVERVRLVRAQVHVTEDEPVEINGETLIRRIGRRYGGHRVVFDMAGAAEVPAHHASEGTLILLGLLTVLLGPNPPGVVLLDDLDRALHPKAQSELITQLRALMADRPSLQIVATSHSPYLLDDLRFEEVRLTTLRDDGSTACASLADHPDYLRWKDHMRPGEFWSMVAEDWIKDRGDSAHG